MALESSSDKRKPTNKLLSILSNNIKRLRKEHNLTQERLGEKCEFHPTFISLIERRQRNVTLSTIEVIANAFDVEPYELLNGGDNLSDEL